MTKLTKTYAPFFAILVLVMGGVLVSCAPVAGPKAIDYGTGHDFIFSAEQRHDGSYAMWIRNDSLGIYCLPTREMYEQADKIANSNDTEIVWHYKSLNQSLVTYEYPGCANLESGVVTVTVYVVLDISLAADLPDPPYKSKRGGQGE